MADKKSEAAFILAMDIQGFSTLSSGDHDKVIQRLYPEIANIVTAGGKERLLDRKSMGDGFLFYFEEVSDAADSALNLRTLFSETYFWKSQKFQKHLKCRIGLHAGQFYKMKDAIEEREALFGQNIITAARLEPVVRSNEVWCTESFKAEAFVNRLQDEINFEPLGFCEMAKGWGGQQVYGLYKDGEPQPAQIRAHGHHQVIDHENSDKDYPHTYFALVRLKHRSDGIQYLKKQLTKSDGFNIEAIYDLFGAFDILVRFQSKEEQNEKDFADFLAKGKIMRAKEKLELTKIKFTSAQLKREPVVMIPEGSMEYMKAFTYIRSTTIVANSTNVSKVLDLARGACGNENGIVTHYLNREILILPIVIRTSDYYALAKAVENIEEFVDDQQWEHVTITTYPVQALEEMFPEAKQK